MSEETGKSKVEHLKKYQWKKGESGNPDGRPKGSVSIVDAIKRKLEEELPDASNEEKKTYLDKVVETYLNKAMEDGDTTILKDIIDRTDGKPVQTNVIEGNVDLLNERNQEIVDIYEQISKGNGDDTERKES